MRVMNIEAWKSADFFTRRMHDFMEKINSLFLDALKASLMNTSVDWEDAQGFRDEDWSSLFAMADMHNVLPMIFEAFYCCPAAAQADPALMAACRNKVRNTVVMQAMRTEEALRLLSFLESRDLHPLVVKGIVCRNLYPKPDLRISGDEDIWIPWEEYGRCHQAMLEFGMEPVDPTQDIKKADEVPYVKKGSPLYVELHKSLFPVESKAYGDLNSFFAHARERAVRVQKTGIADIRRAESIQASAPADVDTIATLGFTDHLFYLICHAFKHFLHSGFGLRQVCDIVLFANAYGKAIDWVYVAKCCREIRAEKFAVSIFRIGEKYLTFSPYAACFPEAWRTMDVDESLMLLDLLDAGVFGDGSMSRKHSSTITLQAVSAQKEGKKTSHGLLRSLFPPAKDLEKRYTYLQDRPWLLPAAWTARIVSYVKETRHTGNDGAVKAMEIGYQRVDLLRKYDIID